jgi:hypothetical protein
MDDAAEDLEEADIAVGVRVRPGASGREHISVDLFLIL